MILNCIELILAISSLFAVGALIGCPLLAATAWRAAWRERRIRRNHDQADRLAAEQLDRQPGSPHARYAGLAEALPQSPRARFWDLAQQRMAYGPYKEVRVAPLQPVQDPTMPAESWKGAPTSETPAIRGASPPVHHLFMDALREFVDCFDGERFYWETGILTTDTVLDPGMFFVTLANGEVLRATLFGVAPPQDRHAHRNALPTLRHLANTWDGCHITFIRFPTTKKHLYQLIAVRRGETASLNEEIVEAGGALMVPHITVHNEHPYHNPLSKILKEKEENAREARRGLFQQAARGYGRFATKDWGHHD